MIYILYVLTVSSPYLLVFGDDRVRGTREQVMMQVELVRLSCGEGLFMGIFMFMFLSLYFNIWCKGPWPTWLNSHFCMYGLIGGFNEVFIFPVFWGTEALLMNDFLHKWCWCNIFFIKSVISGRDVTETIVITSSLRRQ